MMSTSADALSFIDTLCDAWPQTFAHRHGWWHAITHDGITDDELLSEDCKRQDAVMEEAYKSTADAFRCVHSDILGENDTECSSLSTRKRYSIFRGLIDVSRRLLIFRFFSNHPNLIKSPRLLVLRKMTFL